MGAIIDDVHVLLELGLSAESTDEEKAIVQQSVIRAEGAIKRHLLYNPASASRTEYYPRQNLDALNRDVVWEVEGSQAIQRNRASVIGDELQLKHIPIRDTPAIDLRIDFDGRFGTSASAFPTETKKTEGVDFWPSYDGIDSSSNKLCLDGIIRSVGRWPSSPGSIKIVYTAGYTVAELQGQDDLIDASPIMDAVIEEALRRAKKVLVLWKKSSTVGHSSGTLKSEKLGDYSYSLNTASVDKMLISSGGGITTESKDKLASFINYGLMAV